MSFGLLKVKPKVAQFHRADRVSKLLECIQMFVIIKTYLNLIHFKINCETTSKTNILWPFQIQCTTIWLDIILCLLSCAEVCSKESVFAGYSLCEPIKFLDIASTHSFEHTSGWCISMTPKIMTGAPKVDHLPAARCKRIEVDSLNWKWKVGIFRFCPWRCEDEAGQDRCQSVYILGNLYPSEII